MVKPLRLKPRRAKNAAPPAYSGPPPGATALNGVTLVITPAPATRARGPAVTGLAAGGAYRLRRLPGKTPLPNGGVAYIYAAGPYTVSAPYADPGPGAAPLTYGPYGPGLTVYGPSGAVLPPARYYLRGL